MAFARQGDADESLNPAILGTSSKLAYGPWQ